MQNPSTDPIVGWRNILGLTMLVSLGEAYGLKSASCLSGTGVRTESLEDPASMVTIAQELQVIRNLLAHIGATDGFGVLAGTRYHANAFGALGLALASSPTAATALAFALRFFNLTFALTRFSAVQVDDLTVVTIDDASLPNNLRRFVVERDASVLVTVQRDLNGFESALASIDLTFAPPKDLTPYLEVFGVCPSFSAKANIVRLRSEVLNKPLPQANPLAFKTAEKQCQLLLERLIEQTGLTAQVRELMAHDIKTWASMEAVAEHFCLTSRTLRRRLLAEGAVFVQLRDEVRMALAEELVTTSQMSVEDIASRLSYASATSFISAFKRSKGLTPLAFRRNARAAMVEVEQDSAVAKH